MKTQLTIFLLLLSISLTAQRLSYVNTELAVPIEEHDFQKWISVNIGGDFSVLETSNLKLINESQSNYGSNRAKRFQLFYNNIEVDGCQIIAHFDSGRISFINGCVIDAPQIITHPLIDIEEAQEAAINFEEKNKYKWEVFDVPIDIPLKPQRVLTYLPRQQDKDSWRIELAYRFLLRCTENSECNYVFVSATTKEIIGVQSLVREAIGTAQTLYSGTQLIDTKLKLGKYILLDESRGGGIHTYDYNHNNNTHYSLNRREFRDSDNNWTYSEYFNTNKDIAALDVHWGAMQTYDYFLSTFGRNSFDGNGKSLECYVHYSWDYENARWDPTAEVMQIGDGTSISGDNPFASLDVIAHEYGHAICCRTADLLYENESGAINESLSDIWAACVSAYVDLEKDIWTINEDSEDAMFMRSMETPNLYNQPMTYATDTLWQDNLTNHDENGDVHINSGVMNHWFYLLSEGGFGTNTNNYHYDVTGIGINKSAEIVYLAETEYLTPRSNFADVAIQTRRAAVQLFGRCSAEVQAVQEAWLAVGVEIGLNMYDDVILVVNNIGNSVIRANNSIISYADVVPSSSVVYVAGNNIRLLPGAHVQYGATFHAYISPCRPLPPRLVQKDYRNVAETILDPIDEEKSPVNKESCAEKIMYNGTLYVKKDGVFYTLMGVPIMESSMYGYSFHGLP